MQWLHVHLCWCSLDMLCVFIRPPGTLVPGGLMFYCRCFFFCRHEISELPRPIAVKLCHMIAVCVYFIMQVKEFGGPSTQRNWGPKTCKIRRDFRQLQTSSANISGTGHDIQNRKEMRSPAIPPAFYEESPMNFGPLTTENGIWVWTHPNCIFREIIFRPIGGPGHSNFNTHYRLIKAC